jgi:hypothetical protein
LWWKKTYQDRLFSEFFLFFPVTIIPPVLRTVIHVLAALIRRTKLKSLGSSKNSFGNQGASDRKILSLTGINKRVTPVSHNRSTTWHDVTAQK